LPENIQPNYPDILGYITGGARLNVNVIQCALAIRPRVPRAGRPFEAILLIQNACDHNVDVTATLQLPEQDAKKKPKRFITKSERLVVGLRAAEVGYVVLPVTSLPDTAVSDSYKIGMSVEVKPLGKPKRIRLAEGGGAVIMEYLSEETSARLEELKKLSYSTAKRGLIGTSIEAPFSILSAQVGPLVDLKAGWVNLWRMSDHRDEHFLFERMREILTSKVLPQLKRDKLYEPLLKANSQRVTHSGYILQKIEAHYITKLMLTLLEMADPQEHTFDYLGEDIYYVSTLLKNGVPKDKPLQLPGWCRGVMKAIDHNEKAADDVPALLATSAYDELLRDAIRHGFKMISKTTGQSLGSDDEMASYGERLIQKFVDPNESGFNFADVYLPLVLGGVLFFDRALLPDENVGESLTEIANALQDRRPEQDEDNALVFELAEQVIDRARQKYGYRT
jgi:hypothetical protein